MLLCVTPFTLKGATLLSAVVFVSQIAATFVLLPVGGIMANRIETHKKGRASGWYQAGNLGGVGLGGGVGLWLSTHYNVTAAGIVLCVISIASALVIMLIQDVQHNKEESVLGAITNMGKDVISMVKIPAVLFVIVLICLPIGTGAAANLWSAIAVDWKTDADTVALVTGILSGVVSALGCVVGGIVADKFGNWIAYLGSGTICALVTIIMALMPYHPYVYISGVLAYSLALGLINAAFSSVLLFAIGKKNASTKYSMLSSLGNLPVVYMTTFDGWAHDKHNSKFMLIAEAAVGILFVVICILVLQQLSKKKMLAHVVE
jgi:MFS family permease